MTAGLTPTWAWGWAGYYRTVVSSEIFTTLDQVTAMAA